ncbi:hypothetical protein ACOSQ3_021118 [Xanthoceras sorbifolium]
MEQPSQVSASADHPSPADPAPEVSINLGMEPIIEVEQVSPTVHKISMSPSAKTGKIRNPSKTLLHGSINDPPLLMHATTVDVRSVTPSSTVIANAGPNKIIAKPTQVAVIEAEEHVQCFSARPATSVSVAPSNDKGKGVALAIGCLVRKPGMRWSTDIMLDHPFVQGLDAAEFEAASASRRFMTSDVVTAFHG